MPTDLERLVVSLEASITKYEKTMARAVGVSDKNAKRVETRWKKLDIGASAFAGFARGAVLALAPTLSLAAALNGAKTALKEFGDISDNAKAAGIDSEFFQSLAYQAQQGGIEIDALSGALATFAKNSGLAVEGRGRMVTALKALDIGLLENIRNAKTQEDRIKLVADALANTTDASKKAAIATAAFGDAGLKLADVFKGGADEIERMQVRAKEMGLIVDRELIDRAETLGDEFDTTTKIVHLQLMQALVDLGPVLVWLTGLAGGLAEQIGGAVDNLKPLAEQRRSTIEGSLAGIDLRQNDVNPAMSAGLSQTDADALRKPLLDELKRRAIADLTRQLTAQKPPQSSDLPTLEEIETRDEAAKAALKQAEATKALIADLQFERQIVGLSAQDQEIMNTIRRAGVDVMSEEGLQIRALITETDALRDAQEKAADAAKAYGDIALDAVTGVVDALKDGKIEADEFGSILISALAAAANIALPGSGQLVQALGGLFGGGRARGGPVQAGKAYLVNENTPNSELFIPGQPGVIVPRMRGQGGGAGGGHLNVQSQVQVIDGNLVPVMTRISGQIAGQAINQYDRVLPNRMADKQRRFF